MLENKNKITGIILCGGKSCRFGKDKGLCTLGDKPMIQYAIDNLLPVCDQILVSANDEKYTHLGYQMIKDNYKESGPIGGILAALKHSDNEDNIIVSCDMPFLKQGLFSYILREKNGHLAAAASYNDFIEPLCSYFHKNAISKIEEMIINKSFKMLNILEELNYKKIPIDSSLSFFNENLFLNLNTPEEYKQAEMILNITCQ